MKITIWVHKSEAISGKITNYAYTRPYHDRNEEWVQIQITQDEFANLEDKDKNDNVRSDEWLVEQYNRNRAPEDHITSIDEMSPKLQALLMNTKF